jgi:death on curing protein
MRVLTLPELLSLYAAIMRASGGKDGVRDWNALLSSLAQPHSTFAGKDLYDSITDKSAALCFGLVQNHPFIDGNKRIGHASMEATLMLNGLEINASVDAQEQIILRLASGSLSQREFSEWLRDHTEPLKI